VAQKPSRPLVRRLSLAAQFRRVWSRVCFLIYPEGTLVEAGGETAVFSSRGEANMGRPIIVKLLIQR